VKYDYILTDKGRATAWLRYRMQAPSPLSEWKARVVIDMSHIGFAAFLDSDAESAHSLLMELIKEAHDKREKMWRELHAWIVEEREYEAKAEAAIEAQAIA
jgi:hypothetical protein